MFWNLKLFLFCDNETMQMKDFLAETILIIIVNEKSDEFMFPFYNFFLPNYLLLKVPTG